MTQSNRTNRSGIRIARFLASAGIGSRRKCEEHIKAGMVTVNGRRIDSPALNIDPDTDNVRFRGTRVRPARTRYIMLHKPPGVTCSSRDAHAGKLVTELVPKKLGRLFSVGRLDRDSEGLLILTNDGKFANFVAHPRYGISKKYNVRCRGKLTKPALESMTRGIRDHGEFLKPESVHVKKRGPDSCVLEFVLQEGKKREIRRICSSVGLEVTRLFRESVGTLELGDLPAGRWRHLTQSEIDLLWPERPAQTAPGEAPTNE